VIGAGSTITKNVKDNTLALSRISQREFKKRKK
jgi:bifunctional N-acetylglucosamine-1-phosphate-uridyltransferase/glucosamine-1-phosphate-acetyltransferase GlmU-like protein